MEQKRIVIIGAGPAGLTAAYQLLKKNPNLQITIFEQEESVGGLAKTIQFHGNRVDIGGHRYFSKNEKVNEIWKSILPVGRDGFLSCMRSSHIYYNNKTIEYPVQISWNTFSNIGLKKGIAVLISYTSSMFHKRKVCSLEDFYINQFGRSLYKMFFRDYTEKLWGISADKLSADWGNQRIRKISLREVVIKAFNFGDRRSEDKSFIGEFEYPSYGSGQVWEKMASEIKDLGAVIRYNTQITGISRDTDGRFTLRTESGNLEAADIVLSSMPLNLLISRFENIPEHIYDIGDKLLYRDMIIVAIEYNKKYVGTKWKDFEKDNWVYVQQKDIKFGRIQILNNWSPHACANKNNLLLEVEIFYSKGDQMSNVSDQTLIDYTLQGLIDMQIVVKNLRISKSIVKHIEKAYPVYSGGYHQIEDIRRWVDQQENLYCIGRNGQHHYNNMDHSMLTGIEAAECILDEKKKKERIWEINTENTYHEEK